MATSSKRRNAIAQLVAVLAAVTAGADYFYTLSGDQQVAATFESDDVRLGNPAGITLRIRDGQETHERRFANPGGAGGENTAILHLMIDVLLRHQSGDGPNMIVEMQNVIHDVMLAIAKNSTLNNSVNDAMVDLVEPPIYDTIQNLAAVMIRVRVEYDYEPSVTT